MQLQKIWGFAFGPLASALLGLVTVPLIAWIFDPEDVARINVFQTVISFALLLSVLGLDQAYVREYHEEKDKQQLLLACFLPGFLVLSLMSLSTIYFSSNLAYLLYGVYDPCLYWITLLAFFVNYFLRFFSLILRMEENGWAYSISQVGPRVIQLCLVALLPFAILKKKFIHLQLIYLISMFAALVFYAWNTRSQWQGAMQNRLNPEKTKNLLRFGFPLIFSGLAFWGLSATSIVALRFMSLLEELAIYSVASNFAAAALIFQSVFTVIWAPTVYKWVSQEVDMAVIDNIATQTLALVCVIICLFGCFTWVLDFLLPKNYESVKFIFPCMLIQPLFYTLSEITCVGIGIKRKTTLNIWITLIAMLSNWGMSYLLVPVFGAAGAAASNALAFFVFFLARTEFSARIWRDFPRFQIYLLTSVMLALVVLNNFFGYLLDFYIYAIWFFSLVFVGFYFLPQWQQLCQLLGIPGTSKNPSPPCL